MSISSVGTAPAAYTPPTPHTPPTNAPAAPAAPAKGRDPEWNSAGSVGGFSVPSFPTSAQTGGLNIIT